MYIFIFIFIYSFVLATTAKSTLITTSSSASAVKRWSNLFFLLGKITKFNYNTHT